MIITLTETISLTDREISLLRKLDKDGNPGKNSIVSLHEKKLIEMSYDYQREITGFYWKLTKRGKQALKYIDGVKQMIKTVNEIFSK